MAAPAKKRRRVSLWKLLLVLILGVLFLSGGAALGFFIGVVNDTPAFNPKQLNPPQTTFVYDVKGRVITELHEEQNRVEVRLKDLPPHLPRAFLAIEDHRFYEHYGLDPKGVFRAALSIALGREFQGGSTITQQLIKNAFLTPEQTLRRKIQELFLAIQMERRYTKDEILELYLNRIYFGESAYGVQAAAKTFFGKDATRLSLSESALLAAIAKSPEGYYSPFRNPDAARTRRNIVLEMMSTYGMITSEIFNKAKEEPMVVTKPAKRKVPTAAHFVWYAIEDVVTALEGQYGRSGAFDLIYNGGLKIYTTIDLDLQRKIEAAVAEGLKGIGKPDAKGLLQPQVSALLLDHATGEIKAMVGGREATTLSDLNRATQSLRQPGSAIKPVVVYAPALVLNRLTSGMVIDDSPYFRITGRKQDPKTGKMENELWMPENYTKTYTGLVTVREALTQSLNVPAVKVLEEVGVKKALDWARDNLEISTFVTEGRINDGNLATALGGITKGISLLEMTRAFGVFANRGVLSRTIAVRKVEDSYGRVLLENRPQFKVAMDPGNAWILTHVLQDVIKFGTGQRANIGRAAAGKTGTTTDYADAWFIGYTPNYSAGVWIGHDQPTNMGRENGTGGRVPATIWNLIMKAVHENVPVQDFPRPDNIVEAQICSKSGLLVDPLCPPSQRYTEFYIQGTQPTRTGNPYVQAEVCLESNQLYRPGCSNCTPVTKTFLNRPPFNPTPDGTGRVPLDAKYALPMEYCPLPDPSELPPNDGGPGGTGDDTGEGPAPGGGNGGGSGDDGGGPGGGPGV
ncbi:MAG: PBP1A family penicillin-binding protein [Firmicutes bacterium]|nr:PBP1A family penicillin-binding protein [Bacillota bacterium]